MEILQDEFYQKLKEITDLSCKINNNDMDKILIMMKDHVEEITERYHAHDDHYSIETADLIVLCFELLLANGKNIDEVFNRCLPRFDTKLKQLAREVD
ncbi:MAG: hypothetical protein QCH96_05120 [Candidatus Thermoplasmatota archaeon]|jgi:hypothetical protein|nr:hypothetical protein [Candidatus Thermoplasmatota archaeon]